MDRLTAATDPTILVRSAEIDRICERYKADWRAGRFEAVPGESEWIPLPE